MRRSGPRTEDNVYPGWDVAYTNDGLERLGQAKRGTWGGSSITSPLHDEQWTLSQTGNWEVYKLDLNGDTDFVDTDELNDDQTFNDVNELTARDTDDNGTDNYTLTYDAAGNMTDDGKDYEWVYDAFGRLVEVQNQSQQTVAEYSYNGLGYRTGWHHDVDGDGTVEANTVSNTEGPWFQFVYDTGWRVTATYRASHYSTWTIDANPKEQFVNHAAGLVGIAGSGGSSYIDSVIRRDRDANTNWEAQADAMLEERTYTCQNWRADVIALMTSGGVLVNQVRYDPYGKPFGIAKTDLDADGDVDGTDASLFATYHGASTMPYADWNWDGTKDLSDQSAFTSDYNADSSLGRGDQSYAYSHANGASRKGHAGYEVDPVLTGSEGWESICHVRNRVFLSQLGRWTRRDPLGQAVGLNLYAYSWSLPLVVLDPKGLVGTDAGGSGADDPSCSSDVCLGDIVIAGLGRAPSTDDYAQQRTFDGYHFLGRASRLYPPAPHFAFGGFGVPDFWWHGNWCGPGTGDTLCSRCPDDKPTHKYWRNCDEQDCGPFDWGRQPDGSCPTKTDSDECCKEHDRCYYRSCTDFQFDKSPCQKCCDINMCDCLRDADTGFCEWFANQCMQAIFCNGNGGGKGGSCGPPDGPCEIWWDDCMLDPYCPMFPPFDGPLPPYDGPPKVVPLKGGFGVF